jgi:hypothetical protein
MKELIKKIEKFGKEIQANPLVKEADILFFDSPANLEQLNELEQSGKIEKTVTDFYRVSDGFAISWQPADPNKVSLEIFGAVKVNPFQQVVRKWNGIVFFDGEPDSTPRRKFFPADFFADEAAVGFCTLEGYRDYMYYFKFEGEPVPLYVDFKHYLNLMLLTKGCFYWQYLIFEIIEDKENEVSARIKSELPVVFNDFSFQIFREYFIANRKK